MPKQGVQRDWKGPWWIKSPQPLSSKIFRTRSRCAATPKTIQVQRDSIKSNQFCSQDARSDQIRMKFPLLVASLYATAMVTAQNQTRDGCPKDEYACIDVMNSSQCLEQLVIEKLAPATKEALVKCVEYEGTATKIPGASKVSLKIRGRSRSWNTKTNCFINSCVVARDVTLQLLMLRLWRCSHHHADEQEALPEQTVA